jgi:hypothetical protein
MSVPGRTRRIEPSPASVGLIRQGVGVLACTEPPSVAAMAGSVPLGFVSLTENPMMVGMALWMLVTHH